MGKHEKKKAEKGKLAREGELRPDAVHPVCPPERKSDAPNGVSGNWS